MQVKNWGKIQVRPPSSSFFPQSIEKWSVRLKLYNSSSCIEWHQNQPRY